METPLRDITYRQFVGRYCDTPPTAAQEYAIQAFLDHLQGGFFMSGRGAGKTWVRRKLIQYLCDLEREESEGFRELRITTVEDWG